MEKKTIKVPVEVVAPPDLEMEMSLEVIKKNAQFMLDTPFKVGDYFAFEGTDGKKVKINLIK